MSMLNHVVSRPIKEWFRSLLQAGLKAIAAEEVASLQGDCLEAQAKVLDRGRDLIQKTKGLRLSDDPLERELAERLGRAVVETSMLGRGLMGGATPAERAEILASPLPDSRSGPHAGSLRPEEPRSLPAPDPEQTPAGPPRRPRGRPPGSKSKRPAGQGGHDAPPPPSP